MTGNSGLHPQSSAPRRRARDPLGRQTEQQEPKQPPSTPDAHSRKSSVTHWTLAPLKAAWQHTTTT